MIQGRLPAGLSPLAGPTTVLRMVKKIPSFLPSPGMACPQWGAFTASTTDREEAARRGWPCVGVSVWDEAATTVTQALAFLPSPENYVPYRADLAAVHAVGEPAPGQAFAVCSTPRPDADVPGARGHGDLFGTDDPCGLGKGAFKNLRDELARCFRAV